MAIGAATAATAGAAAATTAPVATPRAADPTEVAAVADMAAPAAFATTSHVSISKSSFIRMLLPPGFGKLRNTEEIRLSEICRVHLMVKLYRPFPYAERKIKCEHGEKAKKPYKTVAGQVEHFYISFISSPNLSVSIPFQNRNSSMYTLSSNPSSSYHWE